MNWREYQRKAADFFTDLKMATEVDARLQGARSTHAVDVVIRFTAFGIEQLWVVECKRWNRPVPKERVLTLQQLAEDVGAHRAFLLCEHGFQSGAVTAARFSNVTLTNLSDLRTNAELDIMLARWDDLYLRLARTREGLHSLTELKRCGEESPFDGMSHIKPGVDDYFGHLGEASMLETSLQRARLGRFPVVCGPADDGVRPELAYDMHTFLRKGDETLVALERWTDEQVAKPWPE